MSFVRKLTPHALAGFMAVIFLDSLRFKFTDHPKTQVIFGALDAWAGSLGLEGLFGHTGLFSQYVIGSVELLAAALLIAGMAPRMQRLQAAGSLAAFLVMAGAVSFHLFTPLGIDPNHDGAGLFAAACANLAFSLVMILGLRRRELAQFAQAFAALFAPTAHGYRA
ncbi:hypothetical protein [Phenylobacterium sp.]|uniref:hypothetical protein n=1 Tax=Phenylobacterium sp. TaxID=1871053 RepID=UPI00286BDC28|nr:hypothetical protein [Phenylobacterium sp.]